MPLPLVLIVDDNPGNLNVLGEVLLPRHAVQVANGGMRALQLARLAPQPELILLDVMMPGIDGFEVLRQLRSEPTTTDIPVVLITALERQVGHLLRAAALHDIGLLGLPDQLLDKPGPLTPAERRLMQAHTLVGAEVLAQVWPAASVPWLPWAQANARSHHERWDGQRYPEGLAGDSNAWPARLMAVVDTYDAVTARRNHRAALPHAEALALVLAERGRQFDPDVTDAFADVCSDWPAIAQRHG